MSRDFEVVPANEVPTASRGNTPSSLSLALERGDTVFIAGGDFRMAMSLRNRGAYLRNRGLRARSKNGERAGVKGVFLWAERNGTEAAS